MKSLLNKLPLGDEVHSYAKSCRGREADVAHVPQLGRLIVPVVEHVGQMEGVVASQAAATLACERHAEMAMARETTVPEYIQKKPQIMNRMLNLRACPPHIGTATNRTR